MVTTAVGLHLERRSLARTEEAYSNRASQEIEALNAAIRDSLRFLSFASLPFKISQDKHEWEKNRDRFGQASSLAHQLTTRQSEDRLDQAQILGARMLMSEALDNQAIIAKRNKFQDRFENFAQLARLQFTSPLTMRLAHPTQASSSELLTLANFFGKKDFHSQKSPDQLFDFLMSAHLIDSYQVQAEMFKFNENALTQTYPNLTVHRIGLASSYVNTLFDLAADDIRNKIGEKGISAIGKKALEKALVLHSRVHEARSNIVKAVVSPVDSLAFRKIKQVLEYYLGQENNVRSIAVLLLTSGDSNNLMSLYKHCIENRNAGREPEFYQSLANAIKIYVEENKSELDVLTHDDIARIYVPEDATEKQIDSYQQMVDIITPKNIKAPEPNGLDINPSQIDWHGISPSNKITLFYDPKSSQVVKIEFDYEIDGKPVFLNCIMDAQKEFLHWNVFALPKESAEMMQFFKSLLLTVQSALKSLPAHEPISDQNTNTRSNSSTHANGSNGHEQRVKIKTRGQAYIISGENEKPNENPKKAENGERKKEYQLALLKKSSGRNNDIQDLTEEKDLMVYVRDQSRRLVSSEGLVEDLLQIIRELLNNPYGRGVNKIIRTKVKFKGEKSLEFAPVRRKGVFRFDNPIIANDLRIVYFIDGNRIILETIQTHDEFSKIHSSKS